MKARTLRKVVCFSLLASGLMNASTLHAEPDFKALFAEANRAAQRGEFELAEQTYERLGSLAPKGLSTLDYEWGATEFKLKHWKQSFEHLKRYLATISRKDPHYASAFRMAKEAYRADRQREIDDDVVDPAEAERTRQANIARAQAVSQQASARPVGSHNKLEQGVPPAEQTPCIYFGSGRLEIDSQNQSLIASMIIYLRTHPNATIRLEGHTDERGGREYNMAVGQRRADAVRSALMVEVSPARIQSISYGSEKPKALGHDERAWAQNRRVDMVVQDDDPTKR